ncbi:sulfite exporter TauE/SafE family protein [Bradyrhizobium prioriisuperbiae]|uniref:sulfite exporter TauE/SafE family protein n=1 Tax=Bradyrhizobium prioriisuperbiae TaxID=2854389 RepID=UPI0028E24FBB|nr:sulfite exporter TauE/SafE family protein [Bradyrhizobium prioritasuperba]
MHDLIAALRDLLATQSLTPQAVGSTLAAVFAAALLRGFTGFGFSLAAVPLLGLFMAPSQAVPVAVGLQLLAGLIDLRAASRACHWPSLRWLIVGAVIGSPVGALVLSVVPAPMARIVIATITAGAVLMLGRGFALAAVPPRLATTIVGLIAGLFNGLAAMPGPPAVVFYMSGPFGRVAARASLLVFFLATSIPAMASVAAVGLLDRRVLWLSVIGLPVMLIGTRIGAYAFHRGSDALHRQVSVASLGIIALGSAIKGFSDLM